MRFIHEGPMSLSGIPADTLPEAAWVQITIFRRMAPEKRLRLTLEMGDTLRGIVADGVRSRHPEFSDEQVKLAAIRICLGEELSRKVRPQGNGAMTTQQDFLAAIAERLETAGIPFMVTGSVGSSFHGQPRATNDVDLVIDPTPAQLDHFLALLGERYCVSPESAREALRGRSKFNVIDSSAGWKADLIVRKDRPFSIEELRRRKVDILQGRPLPVASPEDVILTKLEWARLTPSERQVRDALNVAIGQWLKLDQAYLRKWAIPLGVADLLEELLKGAAEAQPPPEAPVA